MTQAQHNHRDTGQELLVGLKLRFVRAIAIIAIMLSIIGVFFQLSATDNLGPLLINIGFLIFNLVLLYISAKKSLTLASILLIITFTLLTFTPARPLMSILAILVAAALGSQLIYFIVNIVVIIPTIIAIMAVAEGSAVPPHEQFLIFSTIAVGITLRFFMSITDQALRTSGRNTELLTASATIGQEIPRALEAATLLPRAVELIRERFNFYHVQVFLVDEERRYAELKASTGKAGEKLFAIHHRLSVGSQSVIGQVTLTGEPIVARDTDAVHARNELLPQTRAELALPMIDEDKVIGALDIQSLDRDAFIPSEIQALQVMANQLTSALQNTRLFAAQQASINENKRLLVESEINLREIQRLNRELMGQAWTDYVKQDRIISGVTLDESHFQPGADWTENMETASQSRKPVTTEQSDQQLLTVPIELRGEVLGAIEVEVDDEQSAEDSAAMLGAVAQRLAIGLENARLFEETQAITAQEQQINEIVNRYQSANSVEDLLQITLSELSMALGAKHSSIRLSSIQPGVLDNGDSAS